MRRRPLILIAALWVGAACGTDANRPLVTGSSTGIEGDIVGVAWGSDGLFWIEILGPDADTRTALFRSEVNGDSPQEVPLPDAPGCLVTEYYEPTAIPGGRIGLRRWCSSPEAGPPGSRSSLVSVDPSTVAVSELTPPLPILLAGFSWAPDMTAALVSESNRLCSSIARVSGEGIALLPISIGEDGRTWRLDDHFRDRDVSTGCSERGQADWPAWSPTGEGMAFFASPDSIGVEGQARLDVPWNLYVMAPDGSSLRDEVQGVVHPRSLVWSPDGAWLTFGGEINGRGGAWLYEVRPGRLVRFSPDLLSWLAWSRDGSRLVAVRSAPGRYDSSEIVTYDLTSVLGQ